MSRLPQGPRRTVMAVAALIGAFVIALVIPIPSMPDVGRAAVRAEVRERLPGWTIHRLTRTWEGAYSVVTSCDGQQVSFQVVPGHGLPVDDAWIQPTNGYARERLSRVSDHVRYLVWRGDPISPESLSCHDEVARAFDLRIGTPTRH